MQVGHMTPNIVRFTYRQEKGDPGYGSCLWANFDFDTENFILSIHGDRGYYGYGWPVSKEIPFLQQMAKFDAEYLLRKMCKESIVDWALTKEEIIDAVHEQDDYSESDRETAIEDLNNLEDEYDLESSPGATTVYLENWNEDNCRIADIWEYVRTDYDSDAKKIFEIFEEYIQPAIREYLKETDA